MRRARQANRQANHVEEVTLYFVFIVQNFVLYIGCLMYVNVLLEIVH